MIPSREKCSPLPEFQPDLEPMRQLWAAVILRAIDDLRSSNRTHRDSAVWFLTSPESPCDGLMEAIGLDYDLMRENLQPYLDGRKRLPAYKLHEATRRPEKRRMVLPLDIRTVQRAQRIVGKVCAERGVPADLLRSDRRPSVSSVRKEIVRRVFVQRPMRPAKGMRGITHGELARMIGLRGGTVGWFVNILRGEGV
jgi:hypothetical protein